MSVQWGSLTEILGWTLLHFVWQGTLAALALGGILSLLPRRWANPRYVLACATLAAMALLPVATALVLAQRSAVPLELAWAAPGTSVSTSHPDAGPGHGHDPAVIGTRVWPPEVGAGGTRASATAAPLADWFPWLIACWLGGVCVCSIRLAGGWWQARRLIREDAFEADEVWLRAVTRLATRLAVRTPVRLRESARVQVPVVVGALKPVLLLPAAALSGLTPQQVEAVLAHELAHIRRHDYLVNLLQSVVETVLFYHPGVWWVSHTIRVEREHCCDDLAVRACGDPLMYARALTTIETVRQERVGIAMAASSGSLISRVRRLLDVRPPARLATSGWAVLSLTALMVAAAGATGWLGAALKQVPALAQSADVTPAPPHTGPAVEDLQAASADQSLPPAAEPAELHETWAPDDLQPQLDAAMRDVEASIAQALEEAERHTEHELRSATERADAALEEVGADTERIAREALEAAELQTSDALGALLDDRARQNLHRELQESRRQLEAHRGEVERHARELAAQARTMRREILRSHREMLQNLHGEQARAFREQARALAEHARELAARARALAAESMRSFHFEEKDGCQHTPEPPDPPQAPAPPQTPAPPAPNAVPTPPAPPALPAPPAPPALPKGASMNRHKDGTWSMMRSDNGKTVKVEGKGRVAFTDDDTDVKTLDPGGSFSLETKGWASWPGTARVDVTAAKDGSLSRTYRIDGKAVSDTEGRKWLAAVLPEVVRELAIGADARVARILAASGPAGVLDEIARIKSGWARHVYFVQLFDQASLDAAMLDRSLRQARQVDSDFARSEVARKAAERFALDDTSAAGFADLVNAIESDFETRRALGAALARPGLSPSVAARLVKAAIPQGSSGIDSDFEMAELLQALPPAFVDALGPAYVEAVASIGSDFERKRVLAALARRPALPPSQLVSIADLTASMESDFEKAEVLLALARHQRLEGQAKDAVLKAAERIGSDFERGRVLSAVAKPTADSTSSVR